MKHPFFDFFEKIAKDDAALRAFVHDPDGESRAAGLTARQKEALLSGKFSKVERLLRDENPDVAALADSRGLVGTQAAGPEQIGWNMASLMSEITTLQQAEA